MTDREKAEAQMRRFEYIAQVEDDQLGATREGEFVKVWMFEWRTWEAPSVLLTPEQAREFGEKLIALSDEPKVSPEP